MKQKTRLVVAIVLSLVSFDAIGAQTPPIHKNGTPSQIQGAVTERLENPTQHCGPSSNAWSTIS